MTPERPTPQSSEGLYMSVEVFSYFLGRVGAFEKVDSLGVTSEWGNMELLPGYAPSIILLRPGLVRLRYRGGGNRENWEYMALRGGVMTIDDKGKAVILAHEVATPQTLHKAKRAGSEADAASQIPSGSPEDDLLWAEALAELESME